MQLSSISLRGLTRFTDAEPVRVDFAALGPGLIAVVGKNGAGKSTLLESVPAALYRGLPSRPGSLYEHSNGRDTFVEAVFLDNGHELTVRLQVDAEQRKTESYIFENGRPLTNGKATEFEAEVSRRFGSRELFLASVLASQNKAGDFLRMAKRERKALFVELLGLSNLEVLHAAAGTKRAGAETDLAAAKAVLSAIEKELEELPQLESLHEKERLVVDETTRFVELARKDEAAATQALEKVRSLQNESKHLREAAATASDVLSSTKDRWTEAKLAPDQIERDSKARLRSLASIDPDEIESRAEARFVSAMNDLAGRRTKLEVLIAKAPEIEQAQKDLEGIEAEAAELHRQENKVVSLRAELKSKDTLVKAARLRLSDHHKNRAREAQQLRRQTELLDQVPCKTDATLSSACPLLADANKASERLDELGKEPVDETELNEAQVAYDRIQNDFTEGQLAADPVRLEEIRTALPPLREKAAELSSIERARSELDSLATERARLEDNRDQDLQEAAHARERINTETEQITQEKEAALKAADEKIAETHQAFDAAKERFDKALAAYKKVEAETEGLSLTQAESNLALATEKRKSAETGLRETEKSLAGINARLEQLREREAQLEDERRRVTNAEQELGDWKLLERALGRDGVQALEIDAAGPEIARLANELLTACYGPRFSISFETLREKKSARGEYSEAFDIKVYDNGHERPVEAISGGERVIVGEALGLSISIFNSRKSGIQWQTLFRDETAGALDPANAGRYVQMLRRARELAGAHQIVFISHQEDIWSSADACLFIDDGQIRTAEER